MNISNSPLLKKRRGAGVRFEYFYMLKYIYGR